MIIKIQIPVATNVPVDRQFALIYNESRSYATHVKVDDVSQLFRSGEYLVYHKAKRSKSEGIETFPSQGFDISVSLSGGPDVEIDKTVSDKLFIGKRLNNQEQGW